MVGEPESLHMSEPLKARIERHDYDRLLMLSDGVFAIAITLLALDLRLPDHWDGTMSQLFHTAGRPLVGYLFGFGLVGAFWIVHRRLLAELAQVDRVITLLNLLLLGLVGLTPFVARMIAEAGPTRAIPFYLVSVASVLGAIALMRIWAMVTSALLHPGVDRRRWAIDTAFLTAGAIGVAAVGSWSIIAGGPVSSTPLLVVVLAVAMGKQLSRLRQRR